MRKRTIELNLLIESSAKIILAFIKKDEQRNQTINGALIIK